MRAAEKGEMIGNGTVLETRRSPEAGNKPEDDRPQITSTSTNKQIFFFQY